MQKFEIGRNEAGQRFDKYLHKVLKEAPSSFLYKMLRKKNITLNGQKAQGHEILSENDVVSMFFSEETFAKFTGKMVSDTSFEDSTGIREFERAYQEIKGIEVVYEDRDVLILNKPINVLSQKDTPTSLSANEWLIGYLLDQNKITKEELNTFKPSVVNRLDRNTTGLLICGKSLLGTQKMSECVRERYVDKYYMTIVCGKYTKEQTFEGFMVKNEQTNKVTFFQDREMIPKELLDSKELNEVKTGFKPILHQGELTLLSVLLFTGKTHQIRAHLANLGFPILGDPKYGSKKMNKKYGEKVQLLHAYSLEFPLIDGMEISGKTINCSLPQSFDKYFSDVK